MSPGCESGTDWAAFGGIKKKSRKTYFSIGFNRHKGLRGESSLSTAPCVCLDENTRFRL
ncbi:hypothetical protein HMPREF0262_02594 [Clostridium sp. ATCC 29733]|nr:hypothetical protein HMPREF0262_02594 [Clostridium sp. ATCC 29733]